jgi:hypothetical protein
MAFVNSLKQHLLSVLVWNVLNHYCCSEILTI